MAPNETYDWEAAAARMRKRADEDFPTSWQPESPGEELLGHVRRVVMQAPTSFGPAPVVEIETPTGARFSVWLFHKVLRQSFERERIRLNELVLIRYLGKKIPEGGGHEYDNYRLIVERNDEKTEPDWAGMADRYGDDTDARDDERQHFVAASPGPDEDIPFMPTV